MLDKKTFTFELDTKLQEAIARYQTTVQDAGKEFDLLKNAFNPLQTMLQIGNQTMQFYATRPWFNENWFNGNWLNVNNTKSVSTSWQDLTEIQQTALQKLAPGQQKILNDLTGDCEKLIRNAGTADSPQDALANYINTSLDAYENFKENVNQLSQTMASIQSAYNAWLQQSVQAQP